MSALEALGWLVCMLGFAWDTRHFWRRPIVIRELPCVADLKVNGQQWDGRVGWEQASGASDADIAGVVAALDALKNRVLDYRA